MTATFRKPVHPGEILREEFMEPLGLKAYTLSKRLGVTRTIIENIVREKSGISAEIALRLSRYFATSPAFWLNAQKHYELECAQDKIGAALNEIQPHAA